MEKYLKDEYDVFEDEKYLTREEEIGDYFKDSGKDFLDCGQGYCQEEETIICKIDNKFFEVAIRGEVGSAKQDVGDRLYWIDEITSVKYKEIPKPLPKSRAIYKYELSLTEYQKQALENSMKELHIEF